MGYQLLIERDNLKIRSATAADAQRLFDWWNDGQIMSHAGFPNGLGICLENVSELISKNCERNRVLIINFEDDSIGEMSYRTKEEGVAEIGIKICDVSIQGRGLGTKLLEMLIKYLFTSMDYKKIIISTNLKNQRAQHVYEKLGFYKIRTEIDSWKDQLGVLQSTVCYELNRDLKG